MSIKSTSDQALLTSSDSDAFDLKQARQSLSLVMRKDRFRLRRQLDKIEQQHRQNKAIEKLRRRFEDQRDQSLAVLDRRQQMRPSRIEYPADLPVAAKAEDIKQAIAQHQVVIVAGETGSGKTTQIPKMCLDLGRGINGLIAHTQPRRLAARTVAGRIAEELKTPLGEGVGYQIRFQDNTVDTTWVKLMTDGILLAEIQHDRYLERYDTIIIDEAHERSLNIDFLLGYLKQLLPRRPDLKVIITSATIDVERFSRHFNGAPVVEVSGRTFPVELVYRPMEESEAEGDLPLAISHAVEELMAIEAQAPELETGGDILVFLPGEREIRETALFLRKAELPHCDVLPLYARLSAAEQNRVFDLRARKGRRIVLATNVAETSLTVPGIRYVIDPGTARMSRYSYRTKVQRLPIEAVSQSSANQRKGRCGRVAHGVCVRLYSEQDFLGRPEFTDAEIHRTNLAAVMLQMHSMRLGAIDAFPFIDPPDRRLINDGYKLLQELGALDDKGGLTELGRSLSKLPLDPKIGRMVLAAAKEGCLKEVLVVASALSIQDPRERPADKKQAADEKHRRFVDKESDFVSLINLWHYVEEQRQALSSNQFKKMCQREFISYMRVREWRDIHFQLRLACKDLGLSENPQEASYDILHRALLSGLLSHIGFKSEDRIYTGARNRQFRIFPGSGVAKKAPKWLVAAELVETSQLFARMVARIEPEWVYGIAAHLLKRHYSEPHWSSTRGQVQAFETVSLYGMVVSDRKKVHYGPIDPVASREIFIRSALVEREWKTKAAFFKHNNALVDRILELEAKARRRDLLAEEQAIYAFYDERIPADLCNGRSFERWIEKQSRANPTCLYLTDDILLAGDAGRVTEAQFPDTISVDGAVFPLSYSFSPGSIDDGVTATVPVALLNRVPKYRFEWLVPGLLHEKCVALIKSLPKQLRKHFVPAPDMATKALAGMSAGDTPLTQALAQQLRRITGITIADDAWDDSKLDSFYRINLKVVDERGKPLGQGRDNGLLLEQFREKMQASLVQESGRQQEQQHYRRWEFDDLPAIHSFKQAGHTIQAYPAIIDCQDAVSIELMDFANEADVAHRWGLVRLLMMTLSQSIKYLRKELLRGNDNQLKLAGLGERAVILDDLIKAAVNQTFLSAEVLKAQGLDALPRTAAAFEVLLRARRSELVAVAQEYESGLVKMLGHYHKVGKRLKGSIHPGLISSYSDIKQQVAHLIYPGFLLETEFKWFVELPRYMEAIHYRLERMGGQVQKDKTHTRELELLQTPLFELLKASEDEAVSILLRYPELGLYRWMIEEYRVSLFAQNLGARMPVSAKRLKQQWDTAKKSMV
jgi:ATP-dependent helicase HrpA